MSSVSKVSQNTSNSQIDIRLNPENEPPSAEKVIDLLNTPDLLFSFQQNQPSTQRSITLNNKPKETLSEAPLFIKDPIKQGEVFNYLSFILKSSSFSEEYREFLSIEADKVDLLPNKIVALSIIALLNGDIAIKDFIEISTKSESIAGAFINILRPELHFESKTIVTHEDFLEDQLFKDTKEKNVVFMKLFFLINSSSYLKKNENEYKTFLSNLSDEKWTVTYKEAPEKLALFSILAFYDGEINREEMFVINMASAAFKEVQSPNSRVTEVTFRVVEDNEIEEYLEEAGFPPFAEDKEEYIISNHTREKGDKLREKIHDFHSEYSQKSKLEKTFTEYTINKFSRSKNSVIEEIIYYEASSGVGFKNVIDGEKATVVLAPPEFITALYYVASSNLFDPMPRHNFMFGFSKSAEPFYQGVRSVSIASALFELPLVHGCINKTTLGLTIHDLNYHMPLEAINPNIQLFIDTAKELETYAKEKLIEDTDKYNWCIAISNSIIDRELQSYRYGDFFESAYWIFITDQVLKKINVDLDENSDFVEFFKNELFPIITKFKDSFKLLPFETVLERARKNKKESKR